LIILGRYRAVEREGVALSALEWGRPVKIGRAIQVAIGRHLLDGEGDAFFGDAASLEPFLGLHAVSCGMLVGENDDGNSDQKRQKQENAYQERLS
jgi:hypothetical protein